MRRQVSQHVDLAVVSGAAVTPTCASVWVMVMRAEVGPAPWGGRRCRRSDPGRSSASRASRRADATSPSSARPCRARGGAIETSQGAIPEDQRAAHEGAFPLAARPPGVAVSGEHERADSASRSPDPGLSRNPILAHQQPRVRCALRHRAQRSSPISRRAPSGLGPDCTEGRERRHQPRDSRPSRRSRCGLASPEKGAAARHPRGAGRGRPGATPRASNPEAVAASSAMRLKAGPGRARKSAAAAIRRSLPS